MADWTRRRVLVSSAAFAAATATSVISMTTSGSAQSDDVESIAQRVRRLYLAYFLREPDAAGWQFWIESGWSLSHMSNHFAVSPEFTQRYGALDNEQFVLLVYRNVLDREPDPGGYEFWTGMLDNGTTRGWMMVGFSESPEYKNKTRVQAPTPVPTPTVTTPSTMRPPDPGVSTP